MQIPFDQILVHGPFDQRHLGGIVTSIPPQLGNYVAAYALKLLNTAYSRANTSNGRRYVYNLITSNNFQNPSLNGLVELSFRIGWRMVLNREAIAVENAIDNAVEYALAAFVAEQVLTNPVLSQDLNATMVNNVRTTYNAFTAQKASFASVTFQEIGFHNNGTMGSNAYPGTPINTPVLSNQAIAVGLATPTGMSGTGGDEWSQSPQSTGPALSQAAYVEPNHVTSDSVIYPTPMGGLQTTEIKATNTLPVSNPQNFYHPSRVNRQTYPSSITTCKGLHEMDALRHSRPYFGELSMSAQQALVGFAGTSFKMAGDVHKDDLGIKDRLTVEEIKILTSVQDIFDAARQEHRRLGRRLKTPQYITRIMGIALNPIHTDSVFAMIQDALYQQDIRMIGKPLSVAVDCKDPDRPTLAQHERLITAAYIDRMLGRVTNDFLARGLRIKGSLTTFADSIGDCINHIQKNLPPDFNVLFQDFLNTLSDNLRQYSTGTIVDSLKESMCLPDENGEVPPEEGVVVVPIGHTVTYCNMTSNELEWTTSFRGTDIDPKVTPTLDQICFTLREDKARFGFKSSYDWLLTGDGETYLVYANPDISGGYRLFPVTGLNINRLV